MSRGRLLTALAIGSCENVACSTVEPDNSTKPKTTSLKIKDTQEDSLITLQDLGIPEPAETNDTQEDSLITVQDLGIPEPAETNYTQEDSLITVQDLGIPEPAETNDTQEDSLITLQDLGIPVPETNDTHESNISLNTIENSFEEQQCPSTWQSVRNLVSHKRTHISSAVSTTTSRGDLYPQVDILVHDDGDFDSDDSVRDVTWNPFQSRRVSTSSSEKSFIETYQTVPQEQPSRQEQLARESNLPDDTANESLRDVINHQRKRKPRKSLKIRRSELTEKKKTRNTGQAYVTKGKEKRAREMKELENCKLNCKESIPEDIRKMLFEKYWGLGEYQRRVNYINSLISVEQKKTTKLNKTKRRDCTHLYFVSWGQDFCKRVWKKCFCSIFDETHRFLSIVASKKKVSETGIVDTSLRGKFSNIKWSEEVLIKVKEHILSFPQYESHYTRSQTNSMFLPSHLNLQKMYSLYCEIYPEQECVSKTIYTKIFKSLGLSFKKPKLDTCSKCDLLQAKIKFCEDATEKENLETELATHQDKAEKAYEQKRIDKNKAIDDETLAILCFDLEQCLPTPMLSSGLAFYKRSLWTYNLTVHDTKTKKATCYMWHEAIGKRGGNQIASCIYHYLKSLPERIRHIILYSDTCGGQNKNSFVSAMFLTVLSECTYIETIDHKFLVPGHTHMECDNDHAMIEKAKKRMESIHHPRDYYQMIRSAGIQGNKFSVVEMSLQNLYNFEALLKGPFVLKKLNTDKEKFLWPEVCWFRYSNKEHQYFAQYKPNLNNDLPFKILSFKRVGKSIPRSITLQPCSSELLPISAEKKADLMALLPFIDPSVHDFYKSLPSSTDVQNIEPDNVDFEYN